MRFLFNHRVENPLTSKPIPSGQVFNPVAVKKAQAAKEQDSASRKLLVEGASNTAPSTVSVAVNIIEAVEDFQQAFSNEGGQRAMVVEAVNPRDWLNPAKNYKPG